jgi:hypothetical protein
MHDGGPVDQPDGGGNSYQGGEIGGEVVQTAASSRSAANSGRAAADIGGR